MKDVITDRALSIAYFILSTKCTIREAAEKFGVSKTTVHLDVTERLQQINIFLAHDVNKVLKLNKAERHLRGGLATQELYRRK